MNRNRLLGLLSRYALGRRPEVSLIGRFNIRVEEVEIQFRSPARTMLYASYGARLIAQKLILSTPHHLQRLHHRLLHPRGFINVDY